MAESREKQILGAFLLDRTLLEKCDINKSFFTTERQRLVFNELQKGAADIAVVTQRLQEKYPKFEDGFTYIVDCVEGVHRMTQAGLQQLINDEKKCRLDTKIENELKQAMPDREKIADLCKERDGLNLSTNENAVGSNLLRFDDIAEEKISWHIPGVYALGMIHSLGGVQGHGKSLHLIDLAARTSTGAAWPITGEPIPKGDVLYITDEDSRDKIIKPRLRLAGANMSRIFIPDFNVESLILPDDIPKLVAWLAKMPDPKLLYLDPLADYSAGSLNASESATKITKPLKTLADKTGTCIIYSVHFNKNVDLDSIHRVAHSYVLTSKPRLTWLIIKQDAGDDLNPHRIFCCGKTAFKPILNMMFTIKGDEFDTPYIDDWRTAKIQTSDALATGDRRRDLKVEEAEDLLSNNLNDQWKYVDDIKEIAEKEGINMRTIYRASKNLPILDDWDGKRKVWKLETKK